MTHLCFNNMVATQTFLGAIEGQLQAVDSDDLKPVFNSAILLMGKVEDPLVENPLVAERRDVVLNMLTKSIEAQQEFFLFTQKSIQLLVRLAKRNGDVKLWLQANKSKIQWMLMWLSENISISMSQRKCRDVMKPGRGGGASYGSSSYGSSMYGSSSYGATTGSYPTSSYGSSSYGSNYTGYNPGYTKQSDNQIDNTELEQDVKDIIPGNDLSPG